MLYDKYYRVVACYINKPNWLFYKFYDLARAVGCMTNVFLRVSTVNYEICHFVLITVLRRGSIFRLRASNNFCRLFSLTEHMYFIVFNCILT